MVLRSRLIRHIKHRLADEKSTAYFTPRQIVEIQDTLRDDILTIGFAVVLRLTSGLICYSVIWIV